MAHLLVIGASSGIGLEVVRQALELGHAVRAFARSADRIPLDDIRLEKRVGDALDADDVVSALEGIDVVVQALGIPANRDMLFKTVRLFSRATELLVPSMERTGVRRLIAVTGFGAGDSRSSIGCIQWIPFRVFLGRAYDDKSLQESLIRASKLDWVIVRPVILTNGSRSGRYRVLTQRRRWRNGFISRADVADFVLRQIEDDSYLGKTPVLTY